MTDRPILFSREMVRALLAGRKTQTRRVIDFPGVGNVMDFVKVATDAQGRPVYEMKDANGSFVSRPAGKGLVAWFAARSLNATPPRDITHDADIEYDATKRSYAEIGLTGKLRPSMFMPRWASRVTLIVKDVNIERLQAISGADAIAEGAEITTERTMTGPMVRVAAGTYLSPIAWYHRLWDDINGPGAWDANPWVVAYTFVTIHANIDKVAA